MKQYKIFISYANEDEGLAFKIWEILNRVNEFAPYLAKLYPSYGDNFKERIQYALGDSDFNIFLLTKNGINSQWVNQEVGYACAIKNRKPQMSIIPISESSINLKGFITKDTNDILFIDKYDIKYLIANIILSIRNKIPNGTLEGALHLKLKCPYCKDAQNMPYKFDVMIPSHEFILENIERIKTIPNTSIITNCQQCKRPIYLDVFTFEIIN